MCFPHIASFRHHRQKSSSSATKIFYKPNAHSTIFVAGNRDLVFCRQRRKLLSYLILKIVVSGKNLLYVFPAHSNFSSPATKIFVLIDENLVVCVRLYVFPAHSKFSSPATKFFALNDKNRAVCASYNCFLNALDFQ